MVHAAVDTPWLSAKSLQASTTGVDRVVNLDGRHSGRLESSPNPWIRPAANGSDSLGASPSWRESPGG